MTPDLPDSPRPPESPEGAATPAQPAQPAQSEQPEQPAAPEKPASAPTAATEEIRQAVIEELRTVYDPEIPVNIYELGLVYDVEIQPDGFVLVRMTLTSPACPVAESLPAEVQVRAAGAEGANGCEVELVWDPPWDPSRMSEAARLQLGFM